MYWTAGTIRAFLMSIPREIWEAREVFMALNWLLWAYQYPGRCIPWFRDYNRDIAEKAFRLFWPIRIVYWPVMYLLMTPVRFITAFYFDVVIFLGFSITMAFLDLFYPESNTYHNSRGFVRTLKLWVFFPYRLVVFVAQNLRILVQSVCMLALDTVFTTVTAFHGTDGSNVARRDSSGGNETIFQKGMWYVGTGDYGGRGIYFGIHEKVAQHYARGCDEPIIVMARVSLFLLRPIPTLPKKYRAIGQSGNGLRISDEFKQAWLWRTTELFRADHGKWFELCVLMPGKSEQLVKSWRIRPLLVLKDEKWCRIWGGAALFPYTRHEVLAVVYSALVCWVGWLLYPIFTK